MQKHDIPDIGDIDNVTLSVVAPRIAWIVAVVGVVLLSIALLLGWMGSDSLKYFWHAYLVSFCFYLSISLGALFLVALHHASRAGWSVCVRRVSEIVAANVLLMAVLFLPILLAAFVGGKSLYEWTNRSAIENEHVRHILELKSRYLNLSFFTLRAIVYFAVWGGLTWFFWRRSLQQDESGDVDLSLRMERVSYPALIAFALTITFASFDWIMSLTPVWFSTIFGVYFFSGSVVGALAAIILLLIGLQATGRLTNTVTPEHYHELGKLLFAFIVFWGYMAFSQYMLIWYANIPEETMWYLPRQQSAWTAVSLILLFGHLLIPFLGLMSRQVKRRKALLGFWAVWMLVAHWLDVQYLVMPHANATGFPLGPIDICCLTGLGLIYFAGILVIAGNRPLVPTKDPRLGESLGFENI
jgi:hypothetical protein